MRLLDGNLILSASDISAHLACKHLTQLNHRVASGTLTAPSWRDPALDALIERGLEHETRYVAHLKKEGRTLTDLREGDDGSGAERTIQAMREGADAIVQATLETDRWRGRADVLLRVEQPSALGSWSYEVIDTKLAQETKAATLLQLCFYSDLLSSAQGAAPHEMHVVKPGAPFVSEAFRYTDFAAYYRFVKGQLVQILEAPTPPITYPSPVPHCDVCRWRKDCDRQRRDDDHLSFVAGMRSSQIVELNSRGVTTLTAFAERKTALDSAPARGAKETYTGLHAQARVQLRGRTENRPVHDLLPPEPGRGLARLPEPSPGDVFFDLEADPFVEDGGIEYLFGYVVTDRDSLRYEGQWALTRRDERRAFEQFIDAMMARWANDPGMHIYHFSPYEPAALKRLMSRLGTRETEIDRLLRAERFVDLHLVTRQAMRASVESYSLKELEPHFGFSRSIPLREASAAIRRIQRLLEFNRGAEISGEDQSAVEAYNKDDCLATAALRDWLEQLRETLVSGGAEIARSPAGEGDASEAIAERAAEVRRVFGALVAGLPDDRTLWSGSERGRWLLAHLLDYFRRENRSVWWEFFRLQELEPDELLAERKAIAGLEFDCEVEGGTNKCPIHRYRFTNQEASFREDDELWEVGGDRVGKVADVNAIEGFIDIRKRSSAARVHPRALMSVDYVDAKTLDASLLSLARSVSETGIEGTGPFRAARDLLASIPPRLQDGSLDDAATDSPTDQAVRVVQQLDRSVLSIQGPPGAGKTYTAAAMIVTLLRAGKRVGITALSHKVIDGLMARVIKTGAEGGFEVAAVHKVSEPRETDSGAEQITDNAKALAALDIGKLLGGTAWLWARDEAAEKVDFLFVDEAGQLSLAHVLAASRAAHNLVLLGDPQQLQQPQRGAHPEGAEIAALDHVLDGTHTMPADRGIFLDQSWRLPPAICQVTSELYYDGRLEARPANIHQQLQGESPFAGSGIFYAPVEHAGNQNSSQEEVDAVDRIVTHLLANQLAFVDNKHQAKPLQSKDILIVAPYNAQVDALARRMPAMPIGTVDRFQGQERAVVILSLTSSSPEDAPRGLSFLYDPHRLNVATSRAKAVCIIVGSPRLFEAECRTAEQMRWLNGFCRFRESGTIAKELIVREDWLDVRTA